MSTAVDEWLLGKAQLPEFVDAAERGIQDAVTLTRDLAELEQAVRSYEAGRQVRPDERLARLASDLRKALTRFQKSRGDSWRQSAVS